MYWVPKQVIEALDLNVRALRQAGHTAYRKDVVGLQVLRRAPSTVAGLREIIYPYRQLCPPPMRSRGALRPLMVVLPAPISLKIDALVERTRESGDVFFRHDLVGGLALANRLPNASLEEDFLAYSRGKAADARVPGLPLSRVLLDRAPMQGRRALPR
jgi:hypothetical protein